MCFKRKCLIANLLITMHVCISTVNGQVDVRLSGGVTPFQGNVEIRRDNGEWGLVCAMNTLKWDLMEARVVCKQLGFVDAMWTWSNSEYGVSNLSVRVCDISCDVSATSLNDCTISSTGSCNNCQNKHAGVTCYFPGFLGRYKEGNPNRVFQTTSNMYTHGNSFTTIEGCIQTCRDNSKSIAVLNSADECYCGDDDTDYQQYGEAVPGEMINEYAFYGTQQCSGDTGTVPYIQGCGGDYQFDVYDTTIGACGGQYIDDSGYIYSPNFPDKYPRDQNCIWTITVEDNHIIQLSILMYKISTGDYVDIRDGNDVTAPLITWHSTTVYSSGNVLRLQFYSNSDMNTDFGFALTYQALSQCSKPGIHSHQVTTPSPLPDHFNPGDTISFRCTTGYTLNGVSVITCQDDGQWNSRVPTCTAVSCGVPPSFPNAYHTNTAYIYPNTVYYYCNDGYYHSGSGTPSKQCLDYGRWSVGIEPQCIGITSILTFSPITKTSEKSGITRTTRQNELSDESTGTGDTLKYSSTPSEGCTVICDTTLKPSVSSSGNEEEIVRNYCNQKDANPGVYVGFGIVIVIMAVAIGTLVLLYRRARLKSTGTEEREITNLDKSNDRTYQDIITTDGVDNAYQALNYHDEKNKTEMDYVNTPKPGCYEEIELRKDVSKQKNVVQQQAGDSALNMSEIQKGLITLQQFVVAYDVTTDSEREGEISDTRKAMATLVNYVNARKTK